ncbi:pyrroline-5-carboxylate reductase-like [Tripterygium wilfordii]|uniref:Pyrroline-5-carboxylate reductase-like n=1 Tax=Tripterygium wilfordii TaxID=458696 RepID=A0A7J7DV81_TRIWF|nr:pyrroline-5-carboxylate reductase-like [Tripterygium wilfordii]
MASKAGKHPGQLEDDGWLTGWDYQSTIAGIHELEKTGFRGILMNSVAAALVENLSKITDFNYSYSFYNFKAELMALPFTRPRLEVHILMD